MTVGIIVVIAVLVALSGIVFVVRPLVQAIASPTAWVHGDNDQAVFISWTEQNGAVSGTFADTYYDTSSLSPAVRSVSYGFTGIRDGSKITFSTSVLGTTTSFTGTLGWRSLTLQYPEASTGTIQSLTLQPGDEADYNRAVAHVKQQHSDANTLGTPTAAVIYQNALTGSVSDWPGDSNCSGQSDGYHIKGSGDSSLLCGPDLVDQGDVTITVTLKQLSGETDIYAGIALRRPSQGNSYLYGVDANGKWVFAKFTNGNIAVLAGDTADAAIHAGLNVSNALKVTAKGAHFTFFVNGTQVGQADDATYSRGKVGLEVGGAIEVVFTDLTIAKA